MRLRSKLELAVEAMNLGTVGLLTLEENRVHLEDTAPLDRCRSRVLLLWHGSSEVCTRVPTEEKEPKEWTPRLAELTALSSNSPSVARFVQMEMETFPFSSWHDGKCRQ